jgi:anti-anti-sigma factor
MLKPAVQTHDIGGTLVAEFWDCLRLDPAPVLQLRNHYETHVRNRGRPDLVVDLNGVGYAGSAALGNFVALHRVVRPNGGRIVFCNVDPTVAEVFRASKLESLFEFVADRDAALRALAAGPPGASVKGKTEAPLAERPAGTPRGAAAPLRRRGQNRGPEKTN